MDSNKPREEASGLNGNDVALSGSESLGVEIDGRLIIIEKESLLKCAGYLSSSVRVGNPRDLENDNIDLCYRGIRMVKVEECFKLFLPPLERPPEAVEINLIKDSKYYLNNVTFQVQDRLFMVPKHHFLESNIFRSVDSGTPTSESTIILPGVLKANFSALLKLIHSSTSSAELSSDEWESVLMLSTKWQMSVFRKMAIDALSSRSKLPRTRVRLGLDYGIPQWLLSGYLDLVKRNESLTFGDFYMIGIENALVLSQNLRRRYIKRSKEAFFYDPKPSDTPFKEVIDDVFQEEIGVQSSGVDVVDRILLARTYGISEWISAGYFELAARKEDVTLDEAKKLGLEATVKVCRVREKVKVPGTESSFDLGKEVKALFAKELKEALRGGRLYGKAARTDEGGTTAGVASAGAVGNSTTAPEDTSSFGSTSTSPSSLGAPSTTASTSSSGSTSAAAQSSAGTFSFGPGSTSTPVGASSTTAPTSSAFGSTQSSAPAPPDLPSLGSFASTSTAFGGPSAFSTFASVFESAPAAAPTAFVQPSTDTSSSASVSESTSTHSGARSTPRFSFTFPSVWSAPSFGQTSTPIGAPTRTPFTFGSVPSSAPFRSSSSPFSFSRAPAPSTATSSTSPVFSFASSSTASGTPFSFLNPNPTTSTSTSSTSPGSSSTS